MFPIKDSGLTVSACLRLIIDGTVVGWHCNQLALISLHGPLTYGMTQLTLAPSTRVGCMISLTFPNVGCFTRQAAKSEPKILHRMQSLDNLAWIRALISRPPW